MNDEIKDRSGKIKAAKKAEGAPLTPPAGAIDELSLQNALRKRHKQNYPNVILQLTKRVQAVNQTWADVVSKLMRIPGFRLTWYRSEETDTATITGGFVVEIRIGDVYEFHEITEMQLQEAHQYVEVLLMDKVDHSELIARWLEDEAKA